MAVGRRARGGAIMAKSEFPSFSLEGKTAVVTGASGELGANICKALVNAGANGVAVGRNNERLRQTLKSFAEVCGDRITSVQADVTDRSQVRAVMEHARARFGTIDILVTAAGLQVRKRAEEFTDQDWQNVLAVNLTGTFICCQEASRHMIPRHCGRIITISSLTAEIGLPMMAAYVASKGGVRQLTKALAVEWAQHGITVNSIGPGRFRTPMTEDVFSNTEARERFLRLIPAGRAGIPSDLTGAAVFLASDASDYVTGQTLYVDGGWLAAGGDTLR